MGLPAGRTLLLVFLLALLGTVSLVTHPSIVPDPAAQVIWVFDAARADVYRLPTDRQASLLELYKEKTGRSVSVKLIPSRVLDARMLCLILADIRSPDVPDLVEIEIGSAGKYFRAHPEENGLLPLNSYLSSGAMPSQLSSARLTTWTSGGLVFGVPSDVHPVTLTYRRDLFDQAGVDLSACTSWQNFQQACLQYQQYWQSQGHRRLAMQLSRWSASDLMILLRQQRIELIDASGRPSLTDPRLASTVAFYAQLVAGANPISTPVADDLIARDLAEGRTAAVLTPDWRLASLRFDPGLLGRLAMMPLPRFAPTDARTASWGGTMVSIPRNCRDPEASWQLLHFLQLSPEALHARQYHSDTLPAVLSAWSDPVYDRPNPLFTGQRVGRLYAQLAEELPAQRSSPYTTLISQSIAGVLASAQSYLETSGTDGLEEHCRIKLAAAQAELARLFQFAQERQ